MAFGAAPLCAPERHRWGAPSLAASRPRIHAEPPGARQHGCEPLPEPPRAPGWDGGLSRGGPVSWDRLASTELAAPLVLLAVCRAGATTLPVHALRGGTSRSAARARREPVFVRYSSRT